MRIIDSCAQCLYDRQANITDNKEYKQIDKIENSY